MTMRVLLAGSVLSLFAAVPLAAQFEGTVVMNVPTSPGTEMTYYIKGNMLAAKVTSPAQGPAHEVHMIFDLPNHKMTKLVPMGMGGSKGMKMVIDTKDQAESSTTTSDVKALGTSETIAGYKCDDVQVIDNGKPSGTLCLTHDLGFFAYAVMSGMGKRAATPTWAKVLGNKPAFPLKATDEKGKVVMVATSVQKGSIPDDAFTVPDGYQDMSGMMGGRGPQF
jgi:hypothetical protein